VRPGWDGLCALVLAALLKVSFEFFFRFVPGHFEFVSLIDEALHDKDLPGAAWLARNLLELLVWVKYRGISRENAWRFHGDVLRDLKGLLESHAKNCAGYTERPRCNVLSTVKRGGDQLSQSQKQAF
jgi:hypothetical protein